MDIETQWAAWRRRSAARPGAVYAVATETGATLSFAELANGSRRMAAWLARHGAAAGDTVSLVTPNGLMTLRLLLGAMGAGCCVNPVNLLSQADAMRYVLEHSDCRLVVATPEWLDRVRALAEGLPCRVVAADPDALRLDDEDDADESAPPPAPRPEDMALLMYTSGTTGRPKGVMLTQANLAANAEAIVAEHALTESDRVLGELPLYHINAFAVTIPGPDAHRLRGTISSCAGKHVSCRAGAVALRTKRNNWASSRLVGSAAVGEKQPASTACASMSRSALAACARRLRNTQTAAVK